MCVARYRLGSGRIRVMKLTGQDQDGQSKDKMKQYQGRSALPWKGMARQGQKNKDREKPGKSRIGSGQ